MMKVQDRHPNDRPREKLARYGRDGGKRSGRLREGAQCDASALT